MIKFGEFLFGLVIMFAVLIGIPLSIISCSNSSSGNTPAKVHRHWLVQPMVNNVQQALCAKVNFSQEATFTDCDDGNNYINPQVYKDLDK